ncbi:MAG: aspartate carbamoyltransferase catalytic subunit [Deferribacteraceae bacterium]|jgi:aspartate carbamoyltransferase catalytic subunit|nr:aspartate carbamoyltransferase catalytic subunit [Deferribacteraceae bacterium]
MKNFLSTKDLTKEEILNIFDLADTFRELNTRGVKKAPALAGKTVINLFFENSTRTRTSFEIAEKRLSADSINFSVAVSSAQKGETLIDTVHNLESMKADIFVIRHECSGAVKFVADNTPVPVINAGDGLNEHPTQSMLDIYTIRRAKNRLEGLNVTIMGDISHSRVARSNIWAMKTMGMNVRLFGPPTVMPNDVTSFGCKICKNIDEALDDADALIILRIQRERQGELLIPSAREYARFFGVMPHHFVKMKKDSLILHPGPINRGVEISSHAADSDKSAILEQVENGVAIRMAILCMVDKGIKA